MKKLALGLIVLVGLASPAFAKHHYKHHRTVAHHHHRGGGDFYVCGGCVVRETKAGKVAVSSSNGDRLVSAINALWDAGFRGRVHCAASGGHIPGSLHYSGNACDMAQRGWGKTVAIMYHASAIIHQFGLRDGCSFSDCGHIDTGMALARRGHHVRYARVHHHHRTKYAAG